MLLQETQNIFEQKNDFLPINGTDYIELYVGNCKQAAHYYQTAFGFQPQTGAATENYSLESGGHGYKENARSLDWRRHRAFDKPLCQSGQSQSRPRTN